MNTYLKLAIGATALVGVLLIGINLTPAGSGVATGPASSDSTSTRPEHSPAASLHSSPSPTESLRPTQEPTPTAFPAAGVLAIGRHSMTREGVTFSLEITTSGWASQDGFILRKDPVGTPESAFFIFWSDTPDGVFSDPCMQTEGPPSGSASDLAESVANMPDMEVVREPTDVMIGGHPGKHVAVTRPAGMACGPGSTGFGLWYDQNVGGRWPTGSGSTINVWIIDVDGRLVWIDGETFPGASSAIEQEIHQIVDSIEFE